MYRSVFKARNNRSELQPSQFDPLEFPAFRATELEADLFATAWLMLLREDKQSQDVLLRTPEISGTLAIYIFLSTVIVLFVLFASFVLLEVSESK
jgi:hypothetical protein